MPKYHESSSGKVVQCRASVKACPRGESPHGNTPEEVYAKIEEQNKSSRVPSKPGAAKSATVTQKSPRDVAFDQYKRAANQAAEISRVVDVNRAIDNLEGDGAFKQLPSKIVVDGTHFLTYGNVSADSITIHWDNKSVTINDDDFKSGREDVITSPFRKVQPKPYDGDDSYNSRHSMNHHAGNIAAEIGPIAHGMKGIEINPREWRDNYERLVFTDFATQDKVNDSAIKLDEIVRGSRGMPVVRSRAMLDNMSRVSEMLGRTEASATLADCDPDGVVSGIKADVRKGSDGRLTLQSAIIQSYTVGESKIHADSKKSRKFPGFGSDPYETINQAIQNNPSALYRGSGVHTVYLPSPKNSKATVNDDKYVEAMKEYSEAVDEFFSRLKK